MKPILIFLAVLLGVILSEASPNIATVMSCFPARVADAGYTVNLLHKNRVFFADVYENSFFQSRAIHKNIPVQVQYRKLRNGCEIRMLEVLKQKVANLKLDLSLPSGTATLELDTPAGQLSDDFRDMQCDVSALYAPSFQKCSKP